VRNKVKKNSLIHLLAILIILCASKGFASEQKLPVIGGEEIVAMVSDDPITIGEFNRALSSIHSAGGEEKQAGKIDYEGIMKRLITLRLIRQEAINIGLNELPEVRDMVAQNARQTLVGLLRGEYVRGIAADEEEVDRLYKEAVREFKLKSVRFDKKEEAVKIEEEIKSKGNFDEMVNRISADKTGKGNVEGVYFKGQELLPQVIEVVSKMEVGSVSPVIEIKDGFIICKLEDVRLPENLAAKDEARKQALDYKRKMALEEYKDSLIKKYVKIDGKVLESIDYETSAEEFEKLTKDTRIVAEIEGEQPVTVGELTEALSEKYFHGVESALKKKKLNDKKRILLFDNILQKRVFMKEALKQGIDRSPVYKSMVKEYESSVLFDSFIRRVIVPDIKVDDEAVEKYYKGHLKEYSSPEMMRINSIVFLKKDDAESAVERLKKGTDFKWLSANTEGQVDKDAEGLIPFVGTVIATGDLNEDVLKVISGARSGDVRLYTSPEKYYYVLNIQDVFPSQPLPFDDVKKEISGRMFKDELNKSIDDWADKLRKVYEVKVYLKDF
jgi:parvulin-like peptidyl-prolyl isomerase